MDTTRGKGRYEEFGPAPWAGVVLALIVAFALTGPFAHAHPTPAHAAPAGVHGAMRHKQ